MQEYGDPLRPLLGDGIAQSIEALLVQEFGKGGIKLSDMK